MGTRPIETLTTPEPPASGHVLGPRSFASDATDTLRRAFDAFDADPHSDPTGMTVASPGHAARARASRVPATLPESGPPYTNEEEFARGGMAVVHRATEPALRRVVALKRLHPEHGENPDAVAQFVCEAQVTGQLDHPNIVPVHHLGQDASGAWYFAMKLVRGSTLAQLIDEGEALPVVTGRLDDLLGIFIKVCDAVAFAHSRRVLHCDLKPDNILVGAFGAVYVMDWGLAVRCPIADGKDAPPIDEDAPAVAQPMQPGAVAGTPVYMAPEQAMGDATRVDERTDVYLLGGVLYSILTGVAPHPGGSLNDVLAKAAAGVIQPMRDAAGGVELPPGLCRIAERALARDRADRYPNVLELKRAIERYLRGTDRFETRTYEPGEKIVVEGEEGECAFIITSGMAVAYKTADQTRIPLRNLGPGDVFGEIAVLTRKPRTATVEALDTVTVMIVTRESIRDQLGGSSWLAAFVNALAERFRETDARLGELERQRISRVPPR